IVKKGGLPRAKKLNDERLADVRERFSLLLEADFRKPQDDDPMSNWSQLKMILQDVTAKVVGYCSKPNRGWFDENNTAIQELLKNKHNYHRSVLANPNDNAARTLYKASCHTAVKGQGTKK
ncbi:craniofacial development protein 2, partial [Biomphalaria glabrata]